VGTSYHTLLALGELRAVGAALAAAGIDGLVAPAGSDRTAVIPRDDGLNPVRLAEFVSGDAGFAAVSNVVIDSGVLFMRTYRHGRLMHEYVSDKRLRPGRAARTPLLWRRLELTRSMPLDSAPRCGANSEAARPCSRSSSIA
jgi:hypothetical protein